MGHSATYLYVIVSTKSATCFAFVRAFFLHVVRIVTTNSLASIVNVWQQAASDGDVPARDPIGLRFYRELSKNKAMKEKYSRDRTHEAKAQFRAQWAAEKYRELNETRSYRASWKNIDRSKGTYMVLEKAIEQYGYSVDKNKATKAGFNYCMSCSRMGGRWVLWEPMSRTFQFLFLERGWLQLKEDAWCKYQEESSKIESGSPPAPSNNTQPLPSSTAHPDADSKTDPADKRKKCPHERFTFS